MHAVDWRLYTIKERDKISEERSTNLISRACHELFPCVSKFVEMWVMDGSDVNGTWKILLKIRPNLKSHRSIAFWKNDELVVGARDEIRRYYNLGIQEIRGFHIHKDLKLHFAEMKCNLHE